jgi:hypothetical protein
MIAVADAHQDSARDELRRALIARRDGRRVCFPARLADRIVRAYRRLNPERGELQRAVVELEGVLPRLSGLPADHVAEAVHHLRMAMPRTADRPHRFTSPLTGSHLGRAAERPNGRTTHAMGIAR